MDTELLSYGTDQYRDDRLFVMNLTHAKIRIIDQTSYKDLTKGKYKWVLTTYRNNVGLTYFRSDEFGSKEKAIEYLKNNEPQTPLISNDGQPLFIPSKFDRWNFWLEWLSSHQLFSAISEKRHVPFWVNTKGHITG